MSKWIEPDALVKRLDGFGDQQAVALADMVKALEASCIVAGTVINNPGEFALKLQCRTEDGSTFYIKADME